jgi:hypothetical protein
MVEMNDMIMDRMGTHDQISDVLGIEGDLHAECIFNRTH